MALSFLVKPFHFRIQKAVSAAIRQRGEDYYESGRVTVRSVSTGEMIVASVRGSRDYRVRLRLAEDELLVTCDCPFADEHAEICKHIWATILLASTRGLFQRRAIEYVDFDFDAEDEVGPFERTPSSALPDPPQWTRYFKQLPSQGEEHESIPPIPAGAQIIYIIAIDAIVRDGSFVVETTFRTRKKNGDWTKVRPLTIPKTDIRALVDPVDREILSLINAPQPNQRYGYGPDYEQTSARSGLTPPAPEYVVPLLCGSGRVWLRDESKSYFTNIAWDDGPPWVFSLSAERDEELEQYRIRGELTRGDEKLPLDDPICLWAGGLLFRRASIARLDDRGGFPWIKLLRSEKVIIVPLEDRDKLRGALMKVSIRPGIDLPEELRWTEVRPVPIPTLRLKARGQYAQGSLEAEVTFDYDGRVVVAGSGSASWIDDESRTLTLRDLARERAADKLLLTLGAVRSWDGARTISVQQITQLIRKLVSEGWRVEGEKGSYRVAGEFQIALSSGIDWFDLSAEVHFGDQKVKLPQLLAAARSTEGFVRLDDGALGFVPEEWLRRIEPFISLSAESSGDGLRFRSNQIGLLDALLAARPEIESDAVIAAAREKLAAFRGVAPADAPDSFQGELREYQKEGLGWFAFLRDLGFGGCLADDMGLGKTVQVLALLEERRRNTSRGAAPASLIVVPRSLVFNWKEEAARFTPELRILDYTGLDRTGTSEHFHQFDAVITTYGTLRRDIVGLADIEFDYVILDEAQAIKNASSLSAKAARLLRGRNRLALSGTPIENHLGELWSLCEFLNPGMFGSRAASRLPSLLKMTKGVPDEENREILARALRPFILRRTKDQVARELPARVEQTIHCELEGKQRILYDELRDHYRRSLLGRISTEGIQKSKIQILEALLRLRQAACHPGLVDPKRAGDQSAKLETLLPELDVIVSEGHKALVFSQFTKFLAIVRDRLDRQRVAYCYLDGKSQDRQQQVERFQTDPETRIFLVSLKAGGLGLNLTAAEYVFLLDPWWNPAVEAQAIDRAHRIGQQRKVFAYRLVARDTIEEKILMLQQSKRDLAAAIIGTENRLIRDLRPEDLELLLS